MLRRIDTAVMCDTLYSQSTEREHDMSEKYTTTIYWDEQDPDNAGWAYRQRSGDREESGSVCDDIPRDASAVRVIRAAADELNVDSSTIVLAR